MQGRTATVPVFVAVTEGDQILDKQVYTLVAAFPPNVDRLTVTTPPIFMVLPVTPDKTAAAYTILSGFQVNPQDVRQ
jgi:hypothetical protein